MCISCWTLPKPPNTYTYHGNNEKKKTFKVWTWQILNWLHYPWSPSLGGGKFYDAFSRDTLIIIISFPFFSILSSIRNTNVINTQSFLNVFSPDLCIRRATYVRRRHESFLVIVHPSHSRPTVTLIDFY